MRHHPYFPGHSLAGGRLWVSGEHRFLKTGKPLRNFADPGEVRQLIADLPVIRGKGYDNLALNCYWHHFNPSGDGQIEVALDPLRELVAAIRESGMYASLSVETYGVGGGQIPPGFWTRHPETVAVNHLGDPVRDTEYGYDTAVPSLFSGDYLACSRAYMTNLVRELGGENFLYFETTVEPQYMGAQWLDYSASAAAAFRRWREEKGDPAIPEFPGERPVPESFRQHPEWNRFRAENLARWIEGDAAALREGAGAKIWIATDYLDAEEETMVRRLGDPIVFLSGLGAVDIIQVNWAWCNLRRIPNERPYRRIRQVMRECGFDWVVTEHMTINGTDYFAGEMEGLLENTLRNGSHFGWEFVDIAPDRDPPGNPLNMVLPGDFKPQHFGVYEADWSPKPTMAAVDNHWEQWMKRRVAIAESRADAEVAP